MGLSWVSSFGLDDIRVDEFYALVVLEEGQDRRERRPISVQPPDGRSPSRSHPNGAASRLARSRISLTSLNIAARWKYSQ